MTGVQTCALPIYARFVRVVINKAAGDVQPCIDEIEIFGHDGKENLALASDGAIANASSVISGYSIHSAEHLNDGRFGNNYSWIAGGRNPQWVQIELPKTQKVSSVTISRDREGKIDDRTPEELQVMLSTDGSQWKQVASWSVSGDGGKSEMYSEDNGRFGRAFNPSISAPLGAQTQENPEYMNAPFTVECWVKAPMTSRDNIIVADGYESQATKYGLKCNHYRLTIKGKTGFISSDFFGFEPEELVTEKNVADGKWHYIAMVRTSDDVQQIGRAHV